MDTKDLIETPKLNAAHYQVVEICELSVAQRLHDEVKSCPTNCPAFHCINKYSHRPEPRVGFVCFHSGDSWRSFETDDAAREFSDTVGGEVARFVADVDWNGAK